MKNRTMGVKCDHSALHTNMILSKIKIKNILTNHKHKRSVFIIYKELFRSIITTSEKNRQRASTDISLIRHTICKDANHFSLSSTLQAFRMTTMQENQKTK